MCLILRLQRFLRIRLVAQLAFCGAPQPTPQVHHTGLYLLHLHLEALLHLPPNFFQAVPPPTQMIHMRVETNVDCALQKGPAQSHFEHGCREVLEPALRRCLQPVQRFLQMSNHASSLALSASLRPPFRWRLAEHWPFANTTVKASPSSAT